MYGQMHPQVDPVLQKQMLRRELESRQNMLLACVGGLIGAAIGAAAWAAITVATGIQIGFMAVGVGWLVGQLAWQFGRGLSPIYGAAGAVCAVLGCLVGNVLSGCYFMAEAMVEAFPDDPEMHMTFWELAGSFNLDLYWEIIKLTFSPIDILFYLIALYEGWKFSFRQLAI
ncbi:MAG: hypothetical protein JW889_07705 [Verrucomicrobia bacterium]|nr:hypothetical protein [Verrucomicrobiota bacterium]